MRTQLTLLAVLASASLMANAQPAAQVENLPAGNQPYNAAPNTATPSDQTRSAVQAEGASAGKSGNLSIGNQPLGPMVSPHSDTTRAEQRGAGAAAVRSGTLSVGNEPVAGSPRQKANKAHKTAKKTHAAAQRVGDKAAPAQ